MEEFMAATVPIYTIKYRADTIPGDWSPARIAKDLGIQDYHVEPEPDDKNIVEVSLTSWVRVGLWVHYLTTANIPSVVETTPFGRSLWYPRKNQA
jgi:hypothetical protein